jgi:hypothetical protein
MGHPVGSLTIQKPEEAQPGSCASFQTVSVKCYLRFPTSREFAADPSLLFQKLQGPSSSRSSAH